MKASWSIKLSAPIRPAARFFTSFYSPDASKTRKGADFWTVLAARQSRVSGFRVHPAVRSAVHNSFHRLGAVRRFSANRELLGFYKRPKQKPDRGMIVSDKDSFCGHSRAT